MSHPLRCLLATSVGLALWLAAIQTLWGSGQPVVRCATFNLENYLLEALGSRPAKSPEARAKIRQTLRAIDADILALQEVGGTQALAELRDRLAQDGLNYPFHEFVHGFDTNIQVAVLSKFPIVDRRSHTQDRFLLQGRRFRVTRGFAEVEIQATPTTRIVVFAFHLKSRRPAPEADESEIRAEEARILRGKIDAALQRNPLVIAMGDLNDERSSIPYRTLLGKGKGALTDTRPAERNGDSARDPQSRFSPRRIVWTHFYGAEDSFSRIDYIFLSSRLARDWLREETYVYAQPDWGVASDHRPVVVGIALPASKP